MNSITLSALLVTVLVSYVIPIGTALVTKANASSIVKQVVTALLAAVSSFIVTSVQLDGTAVLSKESAILAAGSFLLSQASYLGLYRPHQVNQQIAPGVGVG